MSEVQRYKYWKCGNGHILGMVTRNGNGIRKLMLYRQALNLFWVNLLENDPEEDKEIDVMAIVEGYVADVRCSVCGRVRTWVPGEEAMRELLKRAEGLERGQG